MPFPQGSTKHHFSFELKANLLYALCCGGPCMRLVRYYFCIDFLSSLHNHSNLENALETDV